MRTIDLKDAEGRTIGQHRLLGEALPMVLFKGRRAFIPDDDGEALREWQPDESAILRYAARPRA